MKRVSMDCKKVFLLAILTILIINLISAPLLLAADELTGDEEGTTTTPKLNVNLPAATDQAKKMSLGFTKLFDMVSAMFSPLFHWLFDKNNSSGEDIAIQVLVFFLVTLAVYGILGSAGPFGDKPLVNWLIGAIVAVLGIRFMPEGWLQEMAAPSTAFVAVMVVGIPFMLLFWVTKDLNRALRKFLWAVFLVTLFLLFIYNIDKEFSYAYMIAGVVTLGILFFDKTIEHWFKGEQALNQAEYTSKAVRAQILADIRNLKAQLATPGLSARAASGIRKNISDLMNQLQTLP